MCYFKLNAVLILFCLYWTVMISTCVLVALRCRIKINITLPSSQLDSVIFTIRVTSLNDCELSVNYLAWGIRDTRWTWFGLGVPVECYWEVRQPAWMVAAGCWPCLYAQQAVALHCLAAGQGNTKLVVPSTAFTVNVSTIENVRAPRKIT